MKRLFHLAREIESFCEHRGWGFCFIGGIALQRSGEPRLTLDVDLTVVTGFGREQPYIDEFCASYGGRVSEAAARPIW